MGLPRSHYIDLILECFTIQSVFVLLFLLDRSLGYLRVPLLILLILLLAARERRVEGPAPIGVKLTLVIGLSLRVWYVLTRTPGYSDIIERTADAITSLLSGENPYSIAMDISAGKYQGYKYNPFTFLFYLLPFVTFGFPGLLVCNLILESLIIVLIYLVGSELGSRRTGSWASLFYAICPVAIHEALYRVVVDVLPSALTLVSLYFASRKKPMKAGVALGLSIASKPFPGGPLLLLFLKLKEGRRQIILYSVATALLLIVPFAVWSPSSYIGNTILFSAESRPLVRESIMYFLPDNLESIIKPLQLLSIIVVLLLWMLSKDTIESIPIWYFYLTTLIIVFNHWIHRNYLLWILPYLCICWAERLVRAHRNQ